MADQARAVFTIVRMTPTGAAPQGTVFAVGPHLLTTAFHVTSGIEQGLHIFAPNELGTDHYHDTFDVEGMAYPVTLAE